MAEELSPLLRLLTAKVMPPPRALYHSIRLVRRIQMVHFPTRSDRWWWSYLLVCTFVPWASACRLFAAECYKHATALSLIPLNSSRRAESNRLAPGSGGCLAGELSPFLSLLTATGMPQLRSIYQWIRLSGGFKWSASQLDPTAGDRAIFLFVLLFPGQVPSDCLLQSATSMPQLGVLYH